jgi:hypothetical protein
MLTFHDSFLIARERESYFSIFCRFSGKLKARSAVFTINCNDWFAWYRWNDIVDNIYDGFVKSGVYTVMNHIVVVLAKAMLNTY